MSKADQLGAGRFGGNARPVSARRTAIGAATGVPTAGMEPPTRLPVKRISPNPENPRTALGDLTDLAGSLKEHGQKQAITVMNRDAYIKANPARADDLEADTTHVVVDGSSRLAAAREAGLTHLKVMVDDEQGSDGDAILESALVANIHRSDLDPLDEARALQRLLAIHGSQVKLAKRLRKSQGWVSQRLTLLNLSPELQAIVGEEPVELLRSVAKEPQERQGDALRELKAERARKDAERRTPAVAEPVPPTVPPAEIAANDAVSSLPAAANRSEGKTEGGPEGAGSIPAPQPHVSVSPSRTQKREQRSTAPEVVVPETRPTAGTAPAGAGSAPSTTRRGTVPDSRTADSLSGDSVQGSNKGESVDRLPYGDGASVALHLIQQMSDSEFDRMLTILSKHQSERAGSRPIAD
ncbi:ParB/RepB/Spo0J family partition protein [Streptomyces sp. NPDC058008]|uniref:ParB/RepB/Spo0J family partition protein n=1 Tax=Streptomyces sp. NPDC058008 TaxID=3346303 RepID=UPI0036E63AF4